MPPSSRRRSAARATGRRAPPAARGSRAPARTPPALSTGWRRWNGSWRRLAGGVSGRPPEAADDSCPIHGDVLAQAAQRLEDPGVVVVVGTQLEPVLLRDHQRDL